MQNQKCRYAFEKIKSLLVTTPVLKASDQGFAKSFKLQVNSNDIGIGAVLLQEGDYGIYHSIKLCCFSYKFNKKTSSCLFHHLERAIGSLLELQHLYFDIYKHLGTATAPVKSTINNLTTLKVMIVILDALLRTIM